MHLQCYANEICFNFISDVWIFCDDMDEFLHDFCFVHMRQKTNTAILIFSFCHLYAVI